MRSILAGLISMMTVCAVVIIASATSEPAGARPVMSLAVAQHRAAEAAASSGLYDSKCDGQEPHVHAHFYEKKHAPEVLLRCGTSKYGYTHIKQKHGPFDQDMDGFIALTLRAWNRDTKDGSTYTFFLDTCGMTFRVVVNFEHYSDGYMKGIITAYASIGGVPCG